MKCLLFLHFWLCWVVIAPRGLSLVATSRGLLSSYRMQASPCGGFSCYGAQAPGLGFQ